MNGSPKVIQIVADKVKLILWYFIYSRWVSLKLTS